VTKTLSATAKRSHPEPARDGCTAAG